MPTHAGKWPPNAPNWEDEIGPPLESCGSGQGQGIPQIAWCHTIGSKLANFGHQNWRFAPLTFPATKDGHLLLLC